MKARMTLRPESIETSIRVFIVDNFLLGNETQPIGGTDSFIQNGIMDSTGILELIEFIESTYGINIEESETIPENLDSLSNVVAFVSRKLGLN